jgi:hypothetical protein
MSAGCGWWCSTSAVEQSGGVSIFEPLVRLWAERKSESGNHARVSYKLVAGGTTLLERETGDKMPTMHTLYHRDGDRLLPYTIPSAMASAWV